MEKTSEIASSTNGDQAFRERSSAFSPVLASFAGGATVGGIFGIPGIFIGGAIGGFIGYVVNKNSSD